MNRDELQRAMDVVNASKNHPLIKRYYNALHIVLEAYAKSHNPENGTYYKSDDKYDYFIIKPTEIITMEKGNYIFKQTGYDAYAVDKETGKPKIHFCRSYCNYNLDEIKKVIDESIEEEKNE